MADHIYHNPLDIAALPISSVRLQDYSVDPFNGDTITIKHTHILSESNLTIDPVIRTDSQGLERTIYYKFSLKLYIASENVLLGMQLKNLAASSRIACSVFFGSTGAYSHEGSKYIGIDNNRTVPVSLSLRTESIPGMLRRIATISANLQYYPLIQD